MPTPGSLLFTASSSQRLNVADGTKMVSATGQAQMWGGWYKFTSLSAQCIIMGKGSIAAPSTSEYGYFYHPAVPGVQSVVSNGTTEVGTAYATSPTITTGSWFFIMGWYDPAGGGTINTQINNGTVFSAAAVTGLAANTSVLFTLGSAPGGANPIDAAVNSVFSIQRATAFSTAERTWLYNSGTGRIAADLGVSGTNGEFLVPASNKGDWWDLDDNNTDHTGAFHGVVLASTDSGGPTTPTHLSTGIPRFSIGPATTYTLSGSSSTVLNVPTTYTVTPDGTTSGTVTPHSTGSGTFSPTSLTWVGDYSGRDFTYTPTSISGSPHSISITSSPVLTYAGTPISATVSYPTTSFTKSDAYFSGSWSVGVSGPTAYINGAGFQSTCEFIATGTDLTINCVVSNGGGHEAEFKVDGGSWTPVVPLAYAVFSTATIFSGLSDAAHTVSIRAVISPYFSFNPGGGVGTDVAGPIFNVTGSSPACTPPVGKVSSDNYLLGKNTDDNAGQIGGLDFVRFESGFQLHDNAAQGYYSTPKLISPLLGSDASYVNVNIGGQIRFKATTTTIDIWIVNDGQSYSLGIDGEWPVLRVVTPITNEWGWVNIASGLDGGTEHTYAIVNSFFRSTLINAGSGEVWAVRTPGGSINHTPPAVRDTIIFFGDSITGGQDGLQAGVDGLADDSDFLQGWVPRTAEKLGCQFVNSGIGSTTTRDFTGDLGTFSGSSTAYVTTLSGEGRALHDVVNYAVTPTKIVIMYGRNDVGQAWFPSGNSIELVSEFHTAFTNMLTTINTGLPGIPVYIIGILPSSASPYNAGYGESDRIAFNNAIITIISELGDGDNIYIDPDNWGFGGPPGDATGTDFNQTTLDGLHPDPNGRDIVFNGLYHAINGAKRIAVANKKRAYPSTVYTLRLTGFGTNWNSFHTLTVSAGTLGTPTVLSDTYLTVSYTAPSTPQIVTITDTHTGAVGEINIMPVSLTISPTTAAPNTSITLNFRGLYTLWSIAGQASIFTSPGLDLTGAAVGSIGPGATIEGASINFTTPNNPGGSYVITDTTTGKTATLTLTTPTATSFTLTGPSSGLINVASTNFTITPNDVYTGTITITPSGGGLSSPIVKTFSGSATPQTFTITPTVAGVVTLTPTNNGSLTNPSNLNYTGSSPTATSFTFTGPSTGTVNVASTNFTITPNASYTGTITITPSGGGLSTPIVKTFSGSSTPQTFTITPTLTTLVTLTPTNNGSLTNPSNLNYTASAASATAYTLTGPSGGPPGVASTNFTVTPNGTYSGTITITPSGGGLSSPIVKTFSSSAVAQTFTITPTIAGTVTLTPTNNGALTNPSNGSYIVANETFFTALPNVGLGNVHVAIPLEGTNTLWDQSTVFTMTNAAIISQFVVSNTRATISFIPGNFSGNITISDGIYTISLSRGFYLYNTGFIVNDLPGCLIGLGK